MKYTGERFLPDECGGEIFIEHYQRYQFARRLARGKIVLDAACGEGYGSSLLAEEASMVTGLDIDPPTIENARQKYGNSRLSFLTGSIASLPFETDSFDMAVSFETIEHVDVPTQEAFLREIKRVLKPNGMLIMSTPNKAVYTDLVSGTNHFHIREFYLHEYTEFLEQAFKNVYLLCQFPDLGYFIARENAGETVFHKGKSLEESRYFIALCSDAEPEAAFDTAELTRFDDSMYYFLNASAHKLEETVQKTKEDAETFQACQEQSITELKNRISCLEQTVEDQRQYVEHLERDLTGQKEYILHVEKDREEQSGYISRLEQNGEEQAAYITHLESDLTELKQYIAHLEADIRELTEYVPHLEGDLAEQRQYIEHLEKDIKIQAEYIQTLENRGT